MEKYILAIDAGTTGVTVILFDSSARPVVKLYREFQQHYPKPGWVEHDPIEIWEVTRNLIKQMLALEQVTSDNILAIGITNQRETTVLWDAASGQPIHNAIVWQCRRTAPICEELKKDGFEGTIKEKTGLVADAYFSGTKVKWILDNVNGAARRASKGELRFGTIDTWLVWNLTGGEIHVTDYTNASRTLLFNIHQRDWDDELLRKLTVPRDILPEVKSSSEVIGAAHAKVIGREIPIAGIAGDQQAALFGQNGTKPGAIKNTYGTGCFLLLNTGDKSVSSRNGLLTTLACGVKGEPVYALEGAVFIAGAVVQWLRDGIKIIENAAESQERAEKVTSTEGVYFVPAFTGLGAPHWAMDVRGTIVGLSRGTSREHIVRAALESIAYQTKDLIDAVISDSGIKAAELRVDGGATANDFLMQFQSDILGIPINKPKNIESTAQGAAFLAGLAVGFWRDADELEKCREVDTIYTPGMDEQTRQRLCVGWNDAIRKALA